MKDEDDDDEDGIELVDGGDFNNRTTGGNNDNDVEDELRVHDDSRSNDIEYDYRDGLVRDPIGQETRREMIVRWLHTNWIPESNMHRSNNRDGYEKTWCWSEAIETIRFFKFLVVTIVGLIWMHKVVHWMVSVLVCVGSDWQVHSVC